MKASPKRNLAFFFMLMLSVGVMANSSWAPPKSEGDFDQNRVSWKRLVFEANKAMGSASTRVLLESLTVAEAAPALIESPHGAVAIPADADVLLMTAAIEAHLLFERKKWEGRVWFLPTDGTALQRTRHKPGKGASDKRYRYGPEGVYRRRAEPKDKQEAKLSVDAWSKVRNSYYDHGTGRIDCAQISDPLVLLYVVSATGMSEGRELEVCVFNKKELYRVTLETAGTEQVRVDFNQKQGRSAERVNTELNVLKIRLRPRPQDPNLKNPQAFEFIGLSGDIQILLDPRLGIPVGIRGELPVVGQTDFKLTEVSLIGGSKK